MKSSIRKFLLINLLIAITLTTTLTAIGNYYLDQKDIQEHLDHLMAMSALSYQALLGQELSNKNIEDLQPALEGIPNKIENYYKYHLMVDDSHRNYLDKFNFQVWSQEGKLLLYSPTTHQIPLITDHEGFSDKIINDQKWRIFRTNDEKTKLTIILAERYDTRKELGRRIAQDDLYIMLLTFPLSGLLIWIIIGTGLDSLDRVAQEVANRAPTHLKPVNLHSVPEEIKPVIDELNKLFYRLQEGFEREKRFAADAAHELRTPLAAIKAQAQVALNTNSLSEKNLALQKLIASVNRTTHIVQQLLILSKLVPEATHFQELEKVDLIRITREMLAFLAPTALEKNIDLEFEYEKEIPLFMGQPTALSILVRNLVDNAIRYCEEKGKVMVRIYQELGELILEVKDNGPGIPLELRERVFERFFRMIGNKSTGSGLGLAIVRQICELHGGHVELKSAENERGLTVNVYFPLIWIQKEEDSF